MRAIEGADSGVYMEEMGDWGVCSEEMRGLRALHGEITTARHETLNRRGFLGGNNGSRGFLGGNNGSEGVRRRK